MMAFIRMIAVALALVTSSTWCTQSSERNQYEAREDSPQPQMLTEATDHPSQVHISNQNTKLPAVQVGCGSGFIQENLEKKSEIDKNQLPKLKPKRKRSYTSWSEQVVYSVPYQSISAWKPPIYQLSRPYFIPIYGVQGRIPIYYPPQPLFMDQSKVYTNPGAPKDNPVKKPYKGPSYLPPVVSTTPGSSTTMEIINRFNGGDNYDDRQIWDRNDENPTQTPTTAIIPTRKTRPPGVPKTPPLVHNPTDPQDVGSQNLQPPYDITRTTNPPPAATSRPSRPSEPSKCVWAIISCCSSSNQISYDCFDQRGCSGAFWDTNPCDSEFARAAIAAALNYYNKK